MSVKQPTPILPRRGPSRWLPLVLKLIIVLVAAAVAWRLLGRVGLAEVLQRARRAEPSLVTLAVLSLWARALFMYLRWSQPLRLLNLPVSWSYGFCTLLAAILVNHLTPAARLLGGLVRARYIAGRYSTSFARVFGTVLVDQVSHQAVHGLLTWLSLVVLTWAIGWEEVALALLAALSLLTVCVIVWQRRRRRMGQPSLVRLLRQKVERRARRMGPLLRGGEKVADLFRQAFSDPALQAKMAIYGVAILVVNALAQWFVFWSLGSPVSFWTGLVTVAVGVGAGIVTATPGGVATTEAAMIAVFVALDVPEVDAAAATLVYRGLHYLLVLVSGLPALLYCEMSLGTGLKAQGRRAAADPRDTELPVAGSPADPAG